MYLKVSAADEEVDFDILGLLQVLQSGVDVVQVAMCASLHSDLSRQAIVRDENRVVEDLLYCRIQGRSRGWAGGFGRRGEANWVPSCRSLCDPATLIVARSERFARSSAQYVRTKVKGAGRRLGWRNCR
jgi:hypothetical protein